MNIIKYLVPCSMLNDINDIRINLPNIVEDVSLQAIPLLKGDGRFMI